MNRGDLKLDAPGNLTPEQKKLWDAAYNPKNEALQKANLSGKDLVRWKYQLCLGLPSMHRLSGRRGWSNA